MIITCLLLLSALLLLFLEYVILIKFNRQLELNFILRTIFFSGFFLIQTILLFFSFHFNLGKYLFYYLFFYIDKILVIQDPQDYLFVL